MRTTIKEMKLRARRSLCGNYGSLAGIQILFGAGVFVAMFIMMLLVYLLLFSAVAFTAGQGLRVNSSHTMGLYYGMASVVFCVYMVLVLVMALFQTGFTKIYLELAQAGPLKNGDLLYAFRAHVWKFLGLYGLMFLVGLLSGVPAWVFGYFYGRSPFLVPVRLLLQVLQMVVMYGFILASSQTVFLMIRNPELGVMEGIRESFEMMRGNKLRLLGLWFSFIGWVLLIYLSFGIGSLWVLPYIQCTTAHFHLSLCAEQGRGPFTGRTAGNRGPDGWNGPEAGAEPAGPDGWNGPEAGAGPDGWNGPESGEEPEEDSWDEYEGER